MSNQVINLTAGAMEYTWPLTLVEVTGKDISGVPILLSLGTYSEPGAWQSPDVDEAQSVKSQRVVQMLVGGTLKPAPGTYYVWSKVTDNPEIVPRVHAPIAIL